LVDINDGVATVDVDELEAFVSRAEYISFLHPLGRLHIYHMLADLTKAQKSNCRRVVLTNESVVEWKFWTENGDAERSFDSLKRIIQAKVDTFAASDATTRNYGFIIRSNLIKSFQWSESGVLSGDANIDTTIPDTFPIIEAEFEGASRAVRAAPPNSTVMLHVDNKTVYYSMLKRRFKSSSVQLKFTELMKHMLKENKLVRMRWVGTREMARLGPDGLSRMQFQMEGLTLSKQGVVKFWSLLNEVAEGIAKKMALEGVYPKEMALDCFAGPSQNPFSAHYLCRNDDKRDNKSLHIDFWNYNFKNRHVRGDEFLYLFPPGKIAKAAAQHIALNTKASTVWIVEGEHVPEVLLALTSDIRDTAYVYNTITFARKGNRYLFESKCNKRMMMVVHLRLPEREQREVQEPEVKRARNDYDESWKLYCQDLMEHHGASE